MLSYDNAVTFAIEEENIKQLAVMGGGYDDRSFRFAKKYIDLTVFEFDLPEVIEAKTCLLGIYLLCNLKTSSIFGFVPVTEVLQKKKTSY